MTQLTTEKGLTPQESYAILRAWGWAIVKVPDCLHQNALNVVRALEPVIVLEPIDWYEDDESDLQFESDAEVRADELVRAVERSEDWKWGGS